MKSRHGSDLPSRLRLESLVLVGTPFKTISIQRNKILRSSLRQNNDPSLCPRRLALCSRLWRVRAWAIQRHLSIPNRRITESISSVIFNAPSARITKLESLEFRYADSVASAMNYAELSLLEASRGQLHQLVASASKDLEGIRSWVETFSQQGLGSTKISSLSLSIAINYYHLFGRPTLDELGAVLQSCGGPQLRYLRITAINRCNINPALGPIASLLKLWTPNLETVHFSGEYLGRAEISSLDSLTRLNQLCLQIVRKSHQSDDSVMGPIISGLLLPGANLPALVGHIRQILPLNIGLNVYFSQLRLNAAKTDLLEPRIIGNLLCWLISRRAPIRTIKYLLDLGEIDLDGYFEHSERHTCPTPLISALPHPKYVKLLLQAGCNPCKWITFGESGQLTNAFLQALQHPAASGSLQILLSRQILDKAKQFILKTRLDTDSAAAEAYLIENTLRDPRNGDTLLHLAARESNLKTFKIVWSARERLGINSIAEARNWLGKTVRDCAESARPYSRSREELIRFIDSIEFKM